MHKLTAFEPADLKAFEPEAKVGLIATVNPVGLPHVTLITTLQAKTPTRLIWGQFSEGRSKLHVRENPHTGFLIMTLDRKLWRGKAIWRGMATEGEDYEMFNRKPMFRYNSYFGIHTAHTMDLVETYGREGLPLARLVAASLLTRLARGGVRSGRGEPVLNPWSERLLGRMDTIKFLSYVQDDGFPAIVPLLQCQAADSRRLAFSPVAYADELAAVPDRTPVAVFGLSMEREDVLVRGTFLGYRRHRLPRVGVIDLDWVYNSMPPSPGQVYPAEELLPVTSF